MDKTDHVTKTDHVGDKFHVEDKTDHVEDKTRVEDNSKQTPTVEPATATTEPSSKATKKKKKKNQEPEPEPSAGDSDEEFQRMMGMSSASFGTTKHKKVAGNQVGGVSKPKATQYRQYMNRVGGFNRALSPERKN